MEFGKIYCGGLGSEGGGGYFWKYRVWRVFLQQSGFQLWIWRGFNGELCTVELLTLKRFIGELCTVELFTLERFIGELCTVELCTVEF